jgi:alpha/beta superfamily hydrolase
MRKRKARLYIIPGLGESTRMRQYRGVVQCAKGQGLRVVPVSIDWSDKMNMDDYIKQAEDKIPNKVSQDYILGFSFGAYIAAILSSKKKARGYFFCSISPYFKENIKSIPEESKAYFGKDFMDSLQKHSFPKNGEGQAWFFIGKEDWKLAIEVAKDAYKKWHGKKKLFMISDAGHQLDHKKYEIAVNKVIKTL